MTKGKNHNGPKRARKLEIIRFIYIRDGRSCSYCARELLPLDFVEAHSFPDGHLPDGYPTLDHVIPRSRGGTWDITNLVVACPPCNSSRKADHLPSEVTIRRVQRKVVDASRCDLCHGQGRGWGADKDSPCPDCRGAGHMSIDRYAELLRLRSIELAKVRKRLADTQRENDRLREIIDERTGGTRAWRDRQELVDQVERQRCTIKQMGNRIAELGAGRTDSLAG